MLKLENTEVLGWEHAIRGMRNPMNSWEKSDSELKLESWHDTSGGYFEIGPNDHDLMMRLAKGGPVHAKYRRMIAVYVDIMAPLYWWKEFDTYKIGTVANSCSTMHKIAAKEFEPKDFSHEHLIYPSYQHLEKTIDLLNIYRWCYTKYDDLKNGVFPVSHEVGDIIENMSKKEIWWQMIQLLPSSYNQRRTVQMNYEVLANIYKSRRNHKLDEWHTFCDWIEGLPYSELITGTEPISHEVVSDSTALFLRKSMTIPATAEDIEDSVDISHLVDITCSWDVEELGGERIYAIGPGFTREDLTPYELYLLEKTEKYERRKKEE